MRESLAWLMALDRAHQRAQGELGLILSNAVLAGTAPGALKNGDKTLKKMQKHFKTMAGV